MRPENANPRRVQWTVGGGDRIDYPDDVDTKTADLTTATLLINNTIFTKNAHYTTADLKDLFLGMPMQEERSYKYMRIPHVDMIPQAIINQHNLMPLIHNGFMHLEIRRGMYGLPQACRLANNQLIAFSSLHDYDPVPLYAQLMVP